MALTPFEAAAADLCAFIDASPSPFHAARTVVGRLTAAGFAELDESAAFPTAPGGYVVRRGGSVLAWSASGRPPAETGFRVVAGHTDSPNLRIKPQPDVDRVGYRQLGVEVYGGPLLNSWLDRDLGLSGRLSVRGRGGAEPVLVRVDEPVLRVPQLAIHLDRDVNAGLTLNPQLHLAPVWADASGGPGFRDWLAGVAGVDAADLLAWDLMTHDLTPARPLGRDGEFLAAPRLDNQATCHAGTTALIAAAEDSGGPARPVPVLALFDHEEVGSGSERGAQSTLLTATLERIVAAAGGDRADYLRAMALSVVGSADMAHATHPNYPERHDPQHMVQLNGGPVLKTNAKLRYATDALGAGDFLLACEQAGVPCQVFVSRNDMPCGSTVGPMTAALTGARTVDFGAPMLSMHSARELGGARDPQLYASAIAAFLAPAG